MEEDLHRIDNYPDIISTEIRAGDDEGSIEVIVCNDRGGHVATVNLLVSGESHLGFYCCLTSNIYSRYF